MYLGFGEMMLRISPKGRKRIEQAMPGRAELSFGGAEANVCVSLARLGEKARFVTALPRNPVAQALLAEMAARQVDTSCVLGREEGRLGVFYFELGAGRRPANVVYDREGSAFSLADPDEYDFAAALKGVKWVHVSGITPALSENAYRAGLNLVEGARAAGASVCVDLNYRSKLWRWKPGTGVRELARECMPGLVSRADLLVGSPEAAVEMLDIAPRDTAVRGGKFAAAAFRDAAGELVSRYPNLARISFSLRENLSAGRCRWGGMLFEGGSKEAFFAPGDPDSGAALYDIPEIVDPLGAGDAFAAGLLFRLAGGASDPGEAVRFAAAAGALKHSIYGDFNLASREEIEALMGERSVPHVRR